MVVTVYVDFLSQPCRTLVILLKHTTIPFEVKTVDLLAGDQMKPEYSKITQLKAAPAIQDGDFCLAESVAIVRYLTNKYPEHVPDFWYPKDIQKRARVDEYLAFHHTGTRGGCASLCYSEVLYPFFKGEPASEERIKRDLENLKTQLDKLERVFLRDNAYLMGDEISVADIFAASELINNTWSGRDVMEGRPQLKAYYERVKARLNPIFDEVHAKLYASRESYKKHQEANTWSAKYH